MNNIRSPTTRQAQRKCEVTVMTEDRKMDTLLSMTDAKTTQIVPIDYNWAKVMESPTKRPSQFCGSLKFKGTFQKALNLLAMTPKQGSNSSELRLALPQPQELRLALPEPQELRLALPEPQGLRLALAEPQELRLALPEPQELPLALPEPQEPRLALPEPQELRLALPEPQERPNHQLAAIDWMNVDTEYDSADSDSFPLFISPRRKIAQTTTQASIRENEIVNRQSPLPPDVSKSPTLLEESPDTIDSESSVSYPLSVSSAKHRSLSISSNTCSQSLPASLVDDESLDAEIESAGHDFDDYYEFNVNRLPVLTDENPSKVSQMTNFDITGAHVYFSKEDMETGNVGRVSSVDAVWTKEYEGCFVSRSSSNGTLFGLMEILPMTIRPFESISSVESLLIWVLEGEVTVKTNALEWMSNDPNSRKLVLKSLSYKSNEVIVIPRGLPFSLENKTNTTIKLGYSLYDVK